MDRNLKKSDMGAPMLPIGPKLSVIVPTLNEGRHLAATVASVETRKTGVELIVADGGSSDGTGELAFMAGAKVIRCPRGRGRQLQAGAEAARGDYLLFLHADSILPPGYAKTVKKLLAEPATIAGAFRLRFDRGLRMRVVAAGANFRAKRLHLPYGDQALFLRRDVFDNVGGFRPLDVMEDYDFVQRLKRYGGRLRIAKPCVVTSARRYREGGILRTVLAHQRMLLRWHLAGRRSRSTTPMALPHAIST